MGTPVVGLKIHVDVDVDVDVEVTGAAGLAWARTTRTCCETGRLGDLYLRIRKLLRIILFTSLLFGW